MLTNQNLKPHHEYHFVFWTWKKIYHISSTCTDYKKQQRTLKLINKTIDDQTSPNVQNSLMINY